MWVQKASDMYNPANSAVCLFIRGKSQITQTPIDLYLFAALNYDMGNTSSKSLQLFSLENKTTASV